MEDKKYVRDLFGRDFFIIDPAKTALLVIDMQNTFVAEGAAFESPCGRKILPGINDMILFCRARGIPVIYTQSDESYPSGGLIHARHPLIKNTHEIWRGDPSFELYPGLEQPTDKDYRIVKHKYDAFHDTELDKYLRNMGKDTIILTGVATEVCCESTARGAFFREFKVVFTKDGTGAFNPEIQDIVCKIMDDMFARAMTLEETKAEISEQLEVQKAGK